MNQNNTWSNHILSTKTYLPTNLTNAPVSPTTDTVMSMSSMPLQNDLGERFYAAFVGAFESVAARMYRVWQIPDFVYKRTAAYRAEMLHFRWGYRFINDMIDRKRDELADQLRTEGRDVLEEERAAGTLTYLHKCFWLWRRGVWDRQQVRDEVSANPVCVYFTNVERNNCGFVRRWRRS